MTGRLASGKLYCRVCRVVGRKPRPISTRSTPVNRLTSELLPLPVLPNIQIVGAGILRSSSWRCWSRSRAAPPPESLLPSDLNHVGMRTRSCRQAPRGGERLSDWRPASRPRGGGKGVSTKILCPPPSRGGGDVVYYRRGSYRVRRRPDGRWPARSGREESPGSTGQGGR